MLNPKAFSHVSNIGGCCGVVDLSSQVGREFMIFDWSFAHPHGLLNVADHNENASLLLVQMEVALCWVSFLRKVMAMLALFRVAK